MENNPALLDKQPSYSDRFYTLIPAPGIVRYLRFAVLLKAEIEDVIVNLNGLSPHLVVKNPTDVSPDHFRDSKFSCPDPNTTINFEVISKLIGEQSWKDRLRIHHRVGRLLAENVFSWDAYRQFHFNLRLNKNLAIAEFLEAWIPMRDDDLIESYDTSRDHIILSPLRGDDPTESDNSFRDDTSLSFRFIGCAVFKKTNFVIGRLNAIAEQAARQGEETERKAKETAVLDEAERKRVGDQKAAENLETLKKSTFNTFVYLMEDSRNGAFKIGRSRTPGKRERTLQSEAPSVVLRIAVPGEEQHEKQLHAHFNDKNLRGEWFSLTADDLMWIVAFLKANGDSARATVDYDWLGKLYFSASNQAEKNK